MKLPVVYRWAYDYSVPGAKQDFIPQNARRQSRRQCQGQVELGDAVVTVTLMLMAAIMAIVVWWLLATIGECQAMDGAGIRSRLGSEGSLSLPAIKVGLGYFSRS